MPIAQTSGPIPCRIEKPQHDQRRDRGGNCANQHCDKGDDSGLGQPSAYESEHSQNVDALRRVG